MENSKAFIEYTIKALDTITNKLEALNQNKSDIEKQINIDLILTEIRQLGSIPGPMGAKGDKGEPFIFDDLSNEQKNTLAELTSKYVYSPKDGYTPIRGVDYFNEEDLTQFVENVKREIEKLQPKIIKEFKKEELSDKTKNEIIQSVLNNISIDTPTIIDIARGLEDLPKNEKLNPEKVFNKEDFSKLVRQTQIKSGGGSSGSGGGGGATSLTGLSDVTITSPTNGQGLTFNSSKNKWQNSTLAVGGNMNTSTYDPSGIAEQVVGLTATQTLTNKTIDGGNNTFSNIKLTSTTGTLPITRGGTGATISSVARTNLGVAIGSDVQSYSVNLDSLASLNPSSNDHFVLSNNTNSYKLSSPSDVRTILNVENGADVTDTTNVLNSLNNASLTGVTPTGTDLVIIQDISDTKNIKTVTVQSILDQAGGGGGGYYTPITASTISTSATAVTITGNWSGYDSIKILIPKMKSNYTSILDSVHLIFNTDVVTASYVTSAFGARGGSTMYLEYTNKSGIFIPYFGDTSVTTYSRANLEVDILWLNNTTRPTEITGKYVGWWDIGGYLSTGMQLWGTYKPTTTVTQIVIDPGLGTYITELTYIVLGYNYSIS